ncbi:hypothetical protein Tco_0335868 [Tanacetum coccineum]
MSFSKRSDNSSVCYTKPLDSLKHWKDHFLWVDAFACPVSFPWNTDKTVSKDPLPKSTEFNMDDYAALVAHPTTFRKFLEPFLCLVGMIRYYTLDEDTYLRWTLSAFIHVVDPTKLKIVEKERAEGKKRLLDSTLFDEGSSTDHGDSAVGAGHDVEIELVTDVEDIVAENKLRGDHGTSSGVATGGKSLFVLKELLASSILSPEVGFTAMATLPFITSSISATTEHEGGDSVTGPNIRTIGPT